MAGSKDIKAVLSRGEIGDHDVEAVLPASPLQVYMMSAWQNRNGSIFFPAFSYSLGMSLKEQEIHSAWSRVTAATPILRTGLLATGVRTIPLIQVVLRPESVHGTPLVQLEVDDHKDHCIIRLKIHHALYDAFSLTSVIARFASELQMEAVEMHSSDIWSRYMCSTVTTLRQLELSKFWTRYLQGSQVSMPLPNTLGAQDEQISLFQAKALPSIGFLREISIKNALTIQSLFFSAYAKVLAAQSSQTDIVFGVYLANRTAMPDLPPSYPTLNLVPLRVDVSDSQDLVSIASQVQRDLLEIGTEGRADAGLWEIAWWTNVKVTSFVNFLSIPDAESEGILKPLSVGDVSAGKLLSNTNRQWLNTNAVLADYPVSQIVLAMKASNANEVACNGY